MPKSPELSHAAAGDLSVAAFAFSPSKPSRVRTASAGSAGLPALRAHSKDSIDLYQVSEDQLTMLDMQQRDVSSEIIWAASGIAGGAAPSAVATILTISSKPLEISNTDLIQLILFMCAIVVIAVVYFMGRKRRNNFSEIIEGIRGQKKGL